MLSTQIVIVSYRRQHLLVKCIEAIRLHYPTTPICVGLQEEEPSLPLKLKLRTDPALSLILRPEPSVTKTLNVCIRASSADIVLILDDDAFPCQGWLEAHRAAFLKTPDLLYTAGREIRTTKTFGALSKCLRSLLECFLKPFSPKSFTTHGRLVGYFHPLGFMIGNFNMPGSCKINSPRACNMALRKKAFLEFGGFDENFIGNAWGFETAFGLDAERRGYEGRFVGSAIVLHHEESSGGTRQAQGREFLDAYRNNHRCLMRRAGPFAWVGAMPRLLKVKRTRIK